MNEIMSTPAVTAESPVIGDIVIIEPVPVLPYGGTESYADMPNTPGPVHPRWWEMPA